MQNPIAIIVIFPLVIAELIETARIEPGPLGWDTTELQKVSMVLTSMVV